MCAVRSALTLSLLLLPASARVVWIQEDFDPLAGNSLLTPRDTSICGGNTALSQCGGNMPSDFCCLTSATICLALDTNSTVTAAICCPKGEDCAKIKPISCNVNLQNLTNTELHAHPPQNLDECGSGCCPMGYLCENNQCVAQSPPTLASSGKPSQSSTPPSKGTSPTTSSGTSTGVAGTATTDKGHPLDDPTSNSGDSDFNGKSFAAGFVPGIVIGAILAALLILLLLRRKRKSSDSYVNEKYHNRDTLTDLGTLDRRPTMHGRSISEPQANPAGGYRTDFLRSTPPRTGEAGSTNANGYTVDVRSPASGPVTPSSSPPKIKALFSRSPFMMQTPSTPPSTQPPMPAHLKRGTLSFKISPVRALRKQKSTHSLRRQMTDASRAPQNDRSDSRTRLRPDSSRSASTETIQVLMPSNEPYTPKRDPPNSATTWNTTSSSPEDTPDERLPPQAQTTYASSSRYPSEVPAAHFTPTRPPLPRQYGTQQTAPYAFLGSPYTPTNNAVGGKANGTRIGLTAPGDDGRRDTTFSGMMERAGLRKSDLIMGPGNRRT